MPTDKSKSPYKKLVDTEPEKKPIGGSHQPGGLFNRILSAFSGRPSLGGTAALPPDAKPLLRS